MSKFRGFGLLIFLAVLAVATAIVMLLWNSVVVNIFNVPAIGFWYAAGLIILCKILFGGLHKGFHAFRGPHGHHGRHGHHGCCDERHPGPGRHGRRGSPADKELFRQMHERFHSMSGEERKEYIRDHMAGHFGGWCEPHARPEDKDTNAGKTASEGPSKDE